MQPTPQNTIPDGGIPDSGIPGPPAGFWRRYAAWTLDAVPIAIVVSALTWPGLVAGMAALRVAVDALSAALASLLGDMLLSTAPPPSVALQALHDPALRAASATLQSALGMLLVPPLLGFVFVALAYGVAFERSSWRATPGKRALGLVVVDDTGRRLAAGHALLRFGAGGLSWLALNIGHALAALPPRHLALHDRISGTRVLRIDADAAMPRWAIAWLALQGVVFVAANAWAFAAMSGAMRSAVDRALS